MGRNMEKSVILKGLKSPFKIFFIAAKLKKDIEFEFEMFDIWWCSSSFSSTLGLESKVRHVRSLNMPKFGCSKFDFFEFIPTLAIMVSIMGELTCFCR